MNIISHRGFWKTQEEKNKQISFERSFELGFGTETDVRDYMGQIVISHDIPDESSLHLDDFFKIFNRYSNPSLLLALNIKSDGLQTKLHEKLIKFGINNYFVFDMSIPDTIGYLKKGINTFSRQSEHEPIPVFFDQCQGIWLDAFETRWFNDEIIINHIQKGKKVVIVSSELHKRNHLELWEYLKKNNIHQLENVSLCTDFPHDATKFFNN